jgi:hypothetical protein
MKFDHRWMTIPLLLGATIFLYGAQLAGQTKVSPAIGSLQSRGEVFVGGVPATSEVTLFPGEVIRTGDDGAANLAIRDRGLLVIAANTEIAFPPGQSGGPLASLHSGIIALRLSAKAMPTSIELGKIALTTASNTAAAAEVEMSADASAHVRCLAGSVGLIAVKSVQPVFLKPGEEATTSADGKIAVIGADASAAGIPAAAGTSKAASIALLAGGGAAAGVAALITVSHAPPMSPTAP